MLKGRPVIATPVISDAAAVITTGTSAIPGGPAISNSYPDMPVTNLLTPQPTDLWRHRDRDGFIKVYFDVPEIVQLVWLGYINATASATWRLRGNTSSTMTTPIYDSGVIQQCSAPSLDLLGWSRRHAGLWLDAPIALQYWQIDFDNVGASYMEAGRLYMAGPGVSLWQPSRGMDFGWSIQHIDPSTRSRSLGGNLWPNAKQGWRELAFRLSFLSESELDENAEKIERLRGAARDVLVIAEPTDSRFLMRRWIYGVMKGLAPSVNQKLDWFRKDYLVEEWEHP